MTAMMQAVEGPAYKLPKFNIKIPLPLAEMGCSKCTDGRVGSGYCDCLAGQNQREHDARVQANEEARLARAKEARQGAIDRMVSQLAYDLSVENTRFLVDAMLLIEGKDEAAKTTLAMLESGYVDGRKGLLFTGEYGVGKTTLAHLLARSYIEQAYDVIWVDFIKWTTAVQGRYSTDESSEDLVHPLMKADYLFIDNLGTNGNEVYPLSRDRMGMLDRVLESRNYGSKKPTFITSNLDFYDIQTLIGLHASNRVLELCTLANVAGENFRM